MKLSSEGGTKAGSGWGVQGKVPDGGGAITLEGRIQRSEGGKFFSNGVGGVRRK